MSQVMVTDALKKCKHEWYYSPYGEYRHCGNRKCNLLQQKIKGKWLRRYLTERLKRIYRGSIWF